MKKLPPRWSERILINDPTDTQIVDWIEARPKGMGTILARYYSGTFYLDHKELQLGENPKFLKAMTFREVVKKAIAKGL